MENKIIYARSKVSEIQKEIMTCVKNQDNDKYSKLQARLELFLKLLKKFEIEAKPKI